MSVLVPFRWFCVFLDYCSRQPSPHGVYDQSNLHTSSKHPPPLMRGNRGVVVSSNAFYRSWFVPGKLLKSSQQVGYIINTDIWQGDLHLKMASLWGGETLVSMNLSSGVCDLGACGNYCVTSLVGSSGHLGRKITAGEHHSGIANKNCSTDQITDRKTSQVKMAYFHENFISFINLSLIFPRTVSMIFPSMQFQIVLEHLVGLHLAPMFTVSANPINLLP